MYRNRLDRERDCHVIFIALDSVLLSYDKQSGAHLYACLHLVCASSRLGNMVGLIFPLASRPSRGEGHVSLHMESGESTCHLSTQSERYYGTVWKPSPPFLDCKAIESSRSLTGPCLSLTQQLYALIYDIAASSEDKISRILTSCSRLAYVPPCS